MFNLFHKFISWLFGKLINWYFKDQWKYLGLKLSPAIFANDVLMGYQEVLKERGLLGVFKEYRASLRLLNELQNKKTAFEFFPEYKGSVSLSNVNGASHTSIIDAVKSIVKAVNFTISAIVLVKSIIKIIMSAALIPLTVFAAYKFVKNILLLISIFTTANVAAFTSSYLFEDNKFSANWIIVKVQSFYLNTINSIMAWFSDESSTGGEVSQPKEVNTSHKTRGAGSSNESRWTKAIKIFPSLGGNGDSSTPGGAGGDSSLQSGGTPSDDDSGKGSYWPIAAGVVIGIVSPFLISYAWYYFKGAPESPPLLDTAWVKPAFWATVAWFVNSQTDNEGPQGPGSNDGGVSTPSSIEGTLSPKPDAKDLNPTAETKGKGYEAPQRRYIPNTMGLNLGLRELPVPIATSEGEESPHPKEEKLESESRSSTPTQAGFSYVPMKVTTPPAYLSDQDFYFRPKAENSEATDTFSGLTRINWKEEAASQKWETTQTPGVEHPQSESGSKPK